MQRTPIALSFLTFFSIFLLAGFSLVFLFGFSAAVLHAQDDDDPAQAEYYGESDCSDCHRDFARAHGVTAHALALQEAEEGDDEEPGSILADFTSGEDVRSVTFPGDDEARPFDADDIVWVIGAGRYAQRYVTELDDDRLVVLPAEWVTEARNGGLLIWAKNGPQVRPTTSCPTARAVTPPDSTSKKVSGSTTACNAKAVMAPAAST